MSEKTTPAADKKAPPPAPKPDPKPEQVTFQSQAKGKRVYNADGRVVAKFRDGTFSTSDPQVVETLDGLDDVRRVDG